MSSKELASYKHRLDSLFTKVKCFNDDLELQSHWARYLCVLVSGYIEIAVQTIFEDYVRDRAHKNISNYVGSQLSHLHNPKMNYIIELSRSFSQEWAEELESATEGELKDAIDSIVANRNQIAHGRSVGMTYYRISAWYQRALRVVNLLEEQCE